MKVILLQDVPSVGKAGDVKDVAVGFARNHLFPQKLAKPATAKNLEQLKDVEAKQAAATEEQLKEIQEVVSKIDGQEVTVPMKVGEKGELFEKVTEQRIVDALKEMKFDIKKKQIELSDPIKEMGEFPVKVQFDHGLEATLQVIVTEKEE